MTPPAAAAAAPAVRPAPARRSRPRHVPAPAKRGGRSEPLVARRLLDQTLRSRIWIAFVAFALIGIVAMQLWLLKLNTGIGRAIEHEALLQRTNSALSAEDSAMSAGDLVEQQAVADGMMIVPPGALLFLHVRGPLDERQAAARLAQPVEATPTTSATQTPSEATPTATAATPTTSEATPTSSTQPEAQAQG
jgi:hypothetical protein